MRHSLRAGFTFIEALVVVIIIAILVAILMPVFSGKPRPGSVNRTRCQSNLKQVGLCVMEYLQDTNDQFPPTGGSQGNSWAARLHPYIKSWGIFQCPSSPPYLLKTTDIYFNARLDKEKLANIDLVSETIMTGDGSNNAPLNTAISSPSANWRQDTASPMFRHLDGANYGFTDGHVKWLKPVKVTTDEPNPHNFTFGVE